MFKKSDVKDIYGLTPMQEGMLLNYQMDPTRTSYLVQMVISLEGAIDIRLFQKAFQLLVQRHDVLRTVFLYRKVKQPVQVVLKKRAVEIDYSDVSFMDKDRAERYVEDVLAEDIRRGFDLERDSMLRMSLIQVAPRSWRAVLTNHHLIMDGWCLGLLFADFIDLYSALVRKGDVVLTPGIPFGRYVKWLEGRKPEEGLRFWERQLSGYEEQVDFPRKYLQAGGQDYQTAEYEF